jgi:hypothetical protein
VLVLDSNGKGILGAGTSTIRNFKTLAALDANKDGVIDASDPAFSEIEVWEDANGIIEPGKPLPGELVPLGSLGVTSIGLASTPVSQEVDGNEITALGSLTFADGTKEPVYDVTFGAAIAAGATLAVGGPSGRPVTFIAPTGTLKLDDAADFTGGISGFNAHDRIDLADIGFGANTTLAYALGADGSGGTLTVSDGAHTASLSLLGQYAAGNFALASNGAGGTLVTDPPAGAGPGGDVLGGSDLPNNLRQNMALLSNYMASTFTGPGIGASTISGSESPMSGAGDTMLAPQPLTSQSQQHP